ncbi:MAG: polysaccharide biosynthesis protein, partial [Syntrophomonadaceae bacterium]|nr:polysaccharide biosynthesis protein [Syntrophomonadaceae bacterium]
MRIGRRAVILILLDTVLIVVAIHLALWLRFDGAIDPKYLTTIHHLLPFAIAIYIISFYICRLYNRMWAYASIRELILITVATTAGSLLIGGLVYIIDGQLLPRSIHIINWILVILMLGIPRLGWRVVRDFFLRPQARKKYRTLIVGAGDAGAMVVRELMSNDNDINLIPVGFIDDHPSKQSLYLHGLKVLGTREDIPELVRKERIENIIIAMPSVSGKTVREILEICRQTPAKLKILPGVYEIIDDRVRVSKIRDVQLEDLLQREPVRLNLEEIAHYLNQKIVLVTGAGGSIGSELCRQICRFRPHKLILLENCENNLYDIDMELEEKHPGLDLLPCMTDIKDMQKINYVFEKYRPQVVFHAAAFKHVPMMEHNPDEAVKNNVLGTRTVAEAADRYGVETFILISTDKAVNPTSV